MKAEVDLPWPLPDITLVNESFSLGAVVSNHHEAVQTTSLRKIPLAGQGTRALPAVLGADGTLTLTGNADQDFVGLKGKDGTVDVRWAGYLNGHFTNVRKVVFNGNDNDDNLTTDADFNIPIVANGGAGNDLLIGGSANDSLNGDAGNDELQGSGGNDTLNGGADNDLASGGEGDDVINGGTERDLLQGNAGNDRINGDDGVDAIEGGSGNDTLSGGEGFDAIYGGS